MTPAEAIRQSIDWGIAGDMLEQAIHRAHVREQIGLQIAAALRAALNGRTDPNRRRR